MIRIRRSPTPSKGAGVLPSVLAAAAGGMTPGSVYVVKTAQDGTKVMLQKGKKAVLESASDKTRHAELITRDTFGGTLTADGTYLNQADYDKFGGCADPTLRLYTFRDSLKKIGQIGGVVALLPALFALLTAVASVFFVWSSQAEASPSAVAGTAQTVLAWAGQPTGQLDATDVGAAQVAAVHQQLDSRSRDAQSCLLGIEGQQAPSVTIPGVTCVPATTPWWRTTVAGSLITGGIALLTALIGIVALRSNYAFQKNPPG